MCESISDTQTTDNDPEDENRLDIYAEFDNPYNFTSVNETDLLDDIQTGRKRDRQMAKSKMMKEQKRQKIIHDKKVKMNKYVYILVFQIYSICIIAVYYYIGMILMKEMPY